MSNELVGLPDFDPSKLDSKDFLAEVGTSKGPGHLMPFGSSTNAPAIRLVDRAREIENAMEFVETGVHGKIDLIAKQIRALQKEAEEILTAAQRDVRLHTAKCNFEKQIGGIYHLYEKNGNEIYFSILSPNDWGGNPPHKFLGSYCLEKDRGFQEV